MEGETMDYEALSKEFLQVIYKYHQMRSQQQLNSAVHGETFVLQYIASHDNATMPSDISKVMCVSSARIATVLNSLENKGLIIRQIDKQDRRRTILKLTPDGQQKASECSHELLDVARRMLEYLGEEDAKNCVRIMGRLTEMCNSEEK